MKCPVCDGTGEIVSSSIRVSTPGICKPCKYDACKLCKGTGKVERSDGIDYNRKIAVPEHKAGQTGG